MLTYVINDRLQDWCLRQNFGFYHLEAGGLLRRVGLACLNGGNVSWPVTCKDRDLRL